MVMAMRYLSKVKGSKNQLGSPIEENLMEIL